MKIISKLVVLVLGWGLNAVALTDEGVNSTALETEQAVKKQQTRADKITSVAMDEAKGLITLLREAASANQRMFDDTRDALSDSVESVSRKCRHYLRYYSDHYRSRADQLNRTVDLLADLVPDKQQKLSSKNMIINCVNDSISDFGESTFLPGVDEGVDRPKGDETHDKFLAWARSLVVHNCYSQFLESATPGCKQSKVANILQKVGSQQLSTGDKTRSAKGGIDSVMRVLDRAIKENQKTIEMLKKNDIFKNVEEYDSNVKWLYLVSKIISDVTEARADFDIQLHCPIIREKALRDYDSESGYSRGFWQWFYLWKK